MAASIAKVLKLLAERLSNESHIEELGAKMGFNEEEIQKFIQNNWRGPRITSDGTHDMLKEWKLKLSKGEEKVELRKVMIEAKFINWADELVPEVDGEQDTRERSFGEAEETGLPQRSTENASIAPHSSGDSDDIQPDGNGIYGQQIQRAQPTQEQLDGVKNYKMDTRQKGQIFIMNNFEREKGNHKDVRKGSAIDVENVQHVFKELGYHPETLKRDLTAKEIEISIHDFLKKVNAQKPKPNSVVLFLMSHGTAEGIEGIDGKYVQFSFIRKQLTKLTNMGGRPKIVFYQSCMGGKEPGLVKCDSGGPSKSASQKTKPKNTDIFEIYATCEGYVAYRDTVDGSWFVQLLCEEFIRSAHKLDLVTMMTNVTAQLTGKESPERGRERQASSLHLEGVGKKLHFLPKYS